MILLRKIKFVHFCGSKSDCALISSNSNNYRLSTGYNYITEDGAMIPQAVSTGKDSMKYLQRRSKRACTRIKKRQFFDTSMVKSKEDFMNVLGLEMKRPMKEDNAEENNNVIPPWKESEENSLTLLNMRKCSVVIVAERCQICKLPFKCISDVIFHMTMRHGNDPAVNDSCVQSNVFTKRQRLNVRRKRLQTANNNNNNNNNSNNLFRLKIRIGEEIISEITINRKHLKVQNSSTLLPRTKTVRSDKNDNFVAFKNDSNSGVVGIDSFDSTRNHYKDYVVGVRPFFNRIRTLRHDSILNEGFRRNVYGSNRSDVFLTAEDKNLPFNNDKTVFSLKLPHMRSLSEDNVMNNKKNSDVTDTVFISELNTSDAGEDTSAKTQSVNKVCRVGQSVGDTEMRNLILSEENEKKNENDDEEIQEILRITRRRRANNNNRENIKYRLDDDDSVRKDSLLLDTEEEFIDMRENRYRLVYTIL